MLSDLHREEPGAIATQPRRGAGVLSTEPAHAAEFVEFQSRPWNPCGSGVTRFRVIVLHRHRMSSAMSRVVLNRTSRRRVGSCPRLVIPVRRGSSAASEEPIRSLLLRQCAVCIHTAGPGRLPLHDKELSPQKRVVHAARVGGDNLCTTSWIASLDYPGEGSPRVGNTYATRRANSEKPSFAYTDRAGSLR